MLHESFVPGERVIVCLPVCLCELEEVIASRKEEQQRAVQRTADGANGVRRCLCVCVAYLFMLLLVGAADVSLIYFRGHIQLADSLDWDGE